MTAPATGQCPECFGPRLANDPAGLRIVHGMACSLLAAEDSRKVADLDALAATWRGSIERPTTATETVLLAALGADPVPDVTIVERVTPSIVRRSWTDFAPDPTTTEETP